MHLQRLKITLAPEPSGYLHIGHLKAAILNRFLADQYQGQFILRFDDTNPLKEDEEFEQTIKEDLAMIEIAYDKVVHTSDHFDKIQDYTEQLIRQGDAFMDDTDGETVSHTSSQNFRCVSDRDIGQGAAKGGDPVQEPRCYY
jgi:glutamyl-tRNA synthetase